MSAKKKTESLASLKKDLELSKAKFEKAVIDKRLDALNRYGRYDAVDPSNERKRRIPWVEKLSEEWLLRPYDRLRAISMGRDLERNFTSAKSLLKQLKLNTVGTVGGKIRLNTEDDAFNQTVSNWFNHVWSKDCDSRDDLCFNEQLQLALASVRREGDCGFIFDDFDDDDGRLTWWEADQFVNVEKSDWESQTQWVESVKSFDGRKRPKSKTIPLQQNSGIVFDSKGRIKAYIVTGKRGLIVAPLKEVTVFPRGVFRMVKTPWRFNQLRGVGDMLTASADLQDLYEMKSKELQSAKVASGMAGKVTRQDPDEVALFKGGLNPEAILDTSSAPTPSPIETRRPSYEAYESLCGGYMEYLLKGEDFEILDFNRPNVHLKDFFDFVYKGAGSSLGLSRAYTTLDPDSTYIGFRANLLLAWVTFVCEQKFLERKVCDFVGGKAIAWGLDKKMIKGVKNIPGDWRAKMSWQWPKMPQVDPLKDSEADSYDIKNGFVDFEELLGPNWREKLVKAGQQLKVAKENEIPLSAFETKAGAPTANKEAM